MKRDRRGINIASKPPSNSHGGEWRCYMRDPDGYLIEVGQYTQIALDWLKSRT